MRFLFINKFLDKHTIYRVPLGILYLSAAIKKAGHEVFICEPNREDVFKKVSSIKPMIIGYSLRTGFHRHYLDLNKRLKERFDFFSIFGGPHATFFPEMIQEEGVDAVALGECEGAAVDLIRNLENNNPYIQTNNFWFKTKEGIFKNSLRPLEQNLDNLNFPDRILLDDYQEVRFSRIHNFIASRGCPFDCSYCFNHKLKELYAGQQYVRRRSVDNLLAEIKVIKQRYNLERIHFEDDSFNLNKPWLREFTSKYFKIPFKCNLRTDLVDEETVSLLKEANCISVTFAIESGNDRIRNEILNRNTSREQIIDCARLLKKYKIKFITENILANPTSVLSDDIETLDLNITCQPDYPTVSFLQPYPSTKVFNISVSHNQFKAGNIDNLNSFFESLPLNIPQKIERNNLQKIFALVVAFPFLRKHINFLISRRILTPFYSFLYNLWRPYCLAFKIMPHNLTIKEFYWLMKRYLTS